MMDRDSYFSERIYLGQNDEIDTEVYAYWEKILGKDVLDSVEHLYGSLNSIIDSSEYKTKDINPFREYESMAEQVSNANGKQGLYVRFPDQKLVFSEFFVPLINLGINDMKKNGNVFLSESVIDEYSNVLLERLGRVSLSSIKDDYTHLISRLKDRIKISDLMESIIGAFSMLSSILLYAVGGLLVFRGKIKLGTLISFATLAGHFTGPFQTLSLVAPQFNVLKETLIRLKELMNYQSDYENGNERIEHFESIDLVKVTYSYLGSAEPDIENITLEINKGEKVAIVGSSGGGKTTIIKLLLNVFSNYDGEILLNKKNIKNILKEDVDRIFAIVTQVPMAMNGTIKENIDLTNSLSEEEIYSCLEMVELREDIEKFPLKLNTYVGENGQNISGGQKQRIAIARALALKPEVIIFDEATSNLDPITEKKICDNLKKLHITQIVITHRLSAVEDADKIYVIDKGKISEFGTYAQLIKVKEGYFAAANK